MVHALTSQTYASQRNSSEFLFSPAAASEDYVLSPEQDTFVNAVLHEATTAAEQADFACTARALLGQPGTGKSATLHGLLRRMSDLGLAAVALSPTGVLADAFRYFWQDTPGITVDTFDGYFYREDDGAVSPYRILGKALVIVDEVGYLGDERFAYAIRCWQAAGRCCPLLFAGDFLQQSPPGGEKPANTHRLWSVVTESTLRQQHRANSSFSKLTAPLRHAWPTRRSLQQLVGDRVLERSGEAAANFLAEHPRALCVAGRKARVREWNAAIADYLFQDHSKVSVPLLTQDSDGHWHREKQPLCAGMRVMVTRNTNKTGGVVNGVFGVIHVIYSMQIGYSVLVRRDDGRIISVFQCWDEDHSCSGVPLTLGYCTTVAKIQGRTLDWILIDPDLCAPGVAYTAVTRVRQISRLYWLGRPLAKYFVPPALRNA